jgi:hypothetical protein
MLEDSHEISEQPERIAQVESDINGLSERIAALRELPEGTQSLLKARHRLTIGRAPKRLGTSLALVSHGFLPDLAPQCMVSHTFDLFD